TQICLARGPAGEGNRTLVSSLEGYSFTIKLHPRQGCPRCRACVFLPSAFSDGIATCQLALSPLALSYETNRSLFPARRHRLSPRGSHPCPKGGDGRNPGSNDDQIQR